MKGTMRKKRVTRDDRIGEDRISFLPDDLLCKILSELPTEDTVRTSVLSKRWTRMWLSVPILDLDWVNFDDDNANAFKSFVNGFLDISREVESCIDKLKLECKTDEEDTSYITQWMHNAVIRKVQHLDIISRSRSVVSPLNLYTCGTLVCLKLCYVSLADCEHHVSLPRLKTMILVSNAYPNDAFLEKLISSCPVLEDLKVERDGEYESKKTVKVLRVRSQSLKSLILYLGGYDFEDPEDAGYWEILIDAPRLNYLCLTDDKSTSFLISKLSSSAKVDINVTFDVKIILAANVVSKRSEVRKFFTGLLSVRDMTISRKTLKIIFQHLKHESLPQFPYMTRLHVKSIDYDLGDYDLEMLPNFLESCPNLKSLVLDPGQLNKKELIMFSSSVPECLRVSLEYIEMKRPISGTEAEMSLVKYFLENSSVLKKFKLRLAYNGMKQDSIVLKALLRLRRCSAYCEVVVEKGRSFM